MGMRSNCRFCNIVDGKYVYEDIDKPMANSAQFISIASIGALVEGWSLIVPKEHTLSMRHVYSSTECQVFVGNMIGLLARRYGRLIAFEHGSNREGSITACGTNHAHLHVVPFEESIVPDMQRSGLDWIRCLVSDIPSIAGDSEYLFYFDIESDHGLWYRNLGYLHVLDSAVSQYFRRLIADRLGREDESDYQAHPYLKTARNTRNNLEEIMPTSYSERIHQL